MECKKLSIDDDVQFQTYGESVINARKIVILKCL